MSNGVKQPSFVKIYHPSCGHCTAMKPAWEKLTKTIKNNYKGNMGLFNVHADALANIKNPAFKSIIGYPTLKIIKNGMSTIDYDGDRSYEDMLNFCLKNMNLSKILEVYKGGYKNKFFIKTRKYRKYRKYKKTKKYRKYKKTKKNKSYIKKS